MDLSSPKLSIVDLFAGAGFLSSAFQRERFRVELAIELNRVAARTYRANVGDHIVVADVRSTRPTGRCDVLVAGPLCQGFSTLGKRDRNNPRNRLGMEVAVWAKALCPKEIVVENVPTYLGSRLWLGLMRRLVRLGYEVDTVVLNAADYGLPQIRHRCFALASKIGLPTIPAPPQKAVATVRQAWKGLTEEPDGVNGHVITPPSAIALARMKVIPPGGDKRDVLRDVPELAPTSWWKIKCQATDVWGRMLWDEPSNTLRTALLNASKGRYIHPEQNRVITLREAARLQSVPDS